MTEPSIIPGCEPMSHVGDRASGVLVLHGFTGNPSSMRMQADALAAAGHHVEQPRLPGHGTTIDDMLTTDWSDWSGEAAAAYDRLAERAERIVVMGLSMGGTLTLATALERQGDQRLVGLVCVNPATQPQPDEVVAMLTEMVHDGTTVMPAIGSDIADESVQEIAYDATPIAPLLSLINDGLVPISKRLGELTVPLLLFTSHNDHVVEPVNSKHLAATYGGPVEHMWLDRSYHVATQDFDRDDITDQSVGFVGQVGGD